jgi:Cu-Zn family superoxide dismutase
MGTLLLSNFSRLEPNSTHGWHVHQNSVSANFTCSSAGGHYNPLQKNHGAPDASKRHVGDYGNFQVGPDGTARFTFNDTGSSLFGEDAITNQAIVIHAGIDDLGLGGDVGSLATGNAGARLGCGNFNVKDVDTNPTGPRFPPSCDGQEIVCVQEGDTLSQIASTYKLTLDKLVAANSQFADDIDLIYPEDKVCIPKTCFPSRKPAACDGDILTKVVGGDTLFKLALANDLDLEDLIGANPQLGPDFDLIFPGDEVCKPKDCGAWDKEAEYVEPTYEIVIEYSKEGTAASGGSLVDTDSGYASVPAQATSSAGSLLASVFVVLGAVGIMAL